MINEKVVDIGRCISFENAQYIIYCYFFNAYY